MRLVLIVDDWNKRAAGSQGYLSNDLASFQVCYGARIDTLDYSGMNICFEARNEANRDRIVTLAAGAL